MSFGDHLEELRHRLILAAAPALPLAIILFFFSDWFIRIMVNPLRRVLEQNQLPPHIQALAPPEVLIIKLKLSLILAAIILAPWIVWQAWLFIRPGLYRQEQRFVHFLVPGSVVLTVAGVALLYFAMLPLMLQVLVRVGADVDLGQGPSPVDEQVLEIVESQDTIPVVTRRPSSPEPGQVILLWPEMDLLAAVTDDQGQVGLVVVPRLDEAAVTQSYRLSTYVSFVLLLLLGIVIAFQMPLVIVLLGWVGLASPDWLASRRRYALLVCGVLAAFLTPADVVSMLVLLFPLYGLYELGILLLRIAPASRVAEGGMFDRVGPGALRRRQGQTTDKTSAAPSQPAEPAQSTRSVARTDAGPDTPPDQPGEPDDAED